MEETNQSVTEQVKTELSTNDSSVVNESNEQTDNKESSDEILETQDLESTEQKTKEEKQAEKKLEKQLKKYKLKVHGKEVEEELDINDDEAITKHLQMSKAAQIKMQEAAELRKAAEEFITLLKTNPRKVLSDPNINVDLKKIAEEYMQEQIENAAKSPEQLEKERLQKELEELKSKYEKDEKERKEAEFKRLQAEQEEKIQSDIESALNTNNLPKTPYTVRKMAEMMMIALQNGIDLSPKDLVPLLRKQMNADIKDLFSASSDDVLEELIGKDTISRIRKRNLAKVKQAAETANQVKTTTASSKKESPKEEKKITIKEFLRG